MPNFVDGLVQAIRREVVTALDGLISKAVRGYVLGPSPEVSIPKSRKHRKTSRKPGKEQRKKREIRIPRGLATLRVSEKAQNFIRMGLWIRAFQNREDLVKCLESGRRVGNFPEETRQELARALRARGVKVGVVVFKKKKRKPASAA